MGEVTALTSVKFCHQPRNVGTVPTLVHDPRARRTPDPDEPALSNSLALGKFDVSSQTETHATLREF